MILPKERDPRFITLRRGGTLTDENHRLLAIWAARCAEHVLHLFEAECPDDERPRKAIESALAWADGKIKMTDSKSGAYHSNAAARNVSDAAKFAALSAGQAAAVAHVAAHELGAAAYAIRAAMSACAEAEREAVRTAEREWQRAQLQEEIKDMVADDQKRRNDLCWNVFD